MWIKRVTAFWLQSHLFSCVLTWSPYFSIHKNRFPQPSKLTCQSNSVTHAWLQRTKKYLGMNDVTSKYSSRISLISLARAFGDINLVIKIFLVQLICVEILSVIQSKIYDHENTCKMGDAQHHGVPEYIFFITQICIRGPQNICGNDNSLRIR